MSRTADSHHGWSGLVAGAALHALEPQEQAQLNDHLDTCAHCRAQLDDYAFVAAELATLSGDADAAPKWESIRPRAMSAEDSIHRVTPDPRSNRRRWWRHRRALVAAAAAALAIGGATAVISATRGVNTPASTASACRVDPGCELVVLHGEDSDVAEILVRGDQAQLVPMHLTASAPHQMYVLWQLPRDGRPAPLARFRAPLTASAVGALSRPNFETAAFALSVEPVAQQLPRQPTAVVATGAAGS